MPSSHTPVVFHTNPCNCCKFSSCHKIFAFRFKILEFSILPNILSSFLSLIVLCQQLPFAVSNNGKGFWRVKLPLLHTKPTFFAIFKSSLSFNHTQNWSENWFSGYLKHALSVSEIHFAVARGLEIIGHVTNCCKRPIVGFLNPFRRTKDTYKLICSQTST